MRNDKPAPSHRMTETLVVIPGFMADARAFMPQLVHLGASRPTLVILPTMGETVEQISAAMAGSLPERFALVGHGLGGLVAIDVLRRMPDAVSRLALIATDHLPELPQAAAARETRIVAARSGRLAQAMQEELPPTILADTPWRINVIDLVQDMAAGLGPLQFQNQSRAMIRRPDPHRTLRLVRVPTLIIIGAQDPLVPVRRAELMVQLMKQARLAVVPDAGHLPMLEQPEVVSDLLRDFLAGPLLLR
ncbi:MAG: alpha/beta hydrolase [Pseudomonadota bacterium]